MKLATLSLINAERQARRAAVLVRNLAGGDRLLREGDLEPERLADDPLGAIIAEALRSGRSGAAIGPAGEALFIEVATPPVKLVVIGAVHISQALAPMARLAGFDMTVIDPRTAFASAERFPEVALVSDWPEAAIPQLGGFDRFTAVVALTHDPKIDDPALDLALRARPFYIGALGSRKTHARRVERLKAAGFDDAAIARIHAPIGLNIGAVTPAEIAVSILAEIVGALRADRRAVRAGATGEAA